MPSIEFSDSSNGTPLNPNKMKPTPELLKELKAYVFAMYFGQQVAIPTKNDVEFSLREVNEATFAFIELKGYVLQLRSLSSISDEEAIEVAKGYNWSGQTKEHFDERVLQFKIDLPCIAIEGYKHRHLYWVFDYLRQQGFALPVFFKGIQYSVNRLVELGIITTDNGN